MIVDLVRNDLSRTAVQGSVKVDELFGIYAFPQVHHMISTVTATLDERFHFSDLPDLGSNDAVRQRAHARVADTRLARVVDGT